MHVFSCTANASHSSPAQMGDIHAGDGAQGSRSCKHLVLALAQVRAFPWPRFTHRLYHTALLQKQHFQVIARCTTKYRGLSTLTPAHGPAPEEGRLPHLQCRARTLGLEDGSPLFTTAGTLRLSHTPAYLAIQTSLQFSETLSFCGRIRD